MRVSAVTVASVLLVWIPASRCAVPKTEADLAKRDDEPLLALQQDAEASIHVKGDHVHGVTGGEVHEGLPKDDERLLALRHDVGHAIQDKAVDFQGAIRGEVHLRDPLDEAAEVIGNIAKSGATLAGGALKVQSKLVAPVFHLGAKVAAPVVKLKSKLAAPLVFVGAAVSKPLVKAGVKVAAPAIKLHQITTAGAAKITEPLADGLSDAVKPITDATRPLDDAFKPVREAASLGLGDLDVQAEVDKVELEEDIDRLAEAAGDLVEDTIHLNALGLNVAQDTFNQIVNPDHSRRRRDVFFYTVQEVGGGDIVQVDVDHSYQGGGGLNGDAERSGGVRYS